MMANANRIPSRNDVFMVRVCSSVAGRLFNEKEVSEILKRASLSRTHGDLADSSGISLTELQQIGAELGFDPDDIALAAQQVETKTTPQTGAFGPRIVLDRMIEGEVSTDDWLGMVAVMQRYHKNSGAVSQRAGNFDWAGSEEGGSLALTVNVRNGRSRIRLESNRWMGILMASVFCPVFAIVFSAVTAKHGYPLLSLAICLLFGGMYFGFVRFFHREHAQSVSGLLDRLVDEVRSDDTVHPMVNSTQARNEGVNQQQTTQP